jgi:hypothetical protein
MLQASDLPFAGGILSRMAAAQRRSLHSAQVEGECMGT